MNTQIISVLTSNIYSEPPNRRPRIEGTVKKIFGRREPPDRRPRMVIDISQNALVGEPPNRRLRIGQEESNLKSLG